MTTHRKQPTLGVQTVLQSPEDPVALVGALHIVVQRSGAMSVLASRMDLASHKMTFPLSAQTTISPRYAASLMDCLLTAAEELMDESQGF